MKHSPHSEVEKPSASPQSPARLQSEALFRGQARVDIEHRGEIYRLHITRQGKLILTK